MDRNAARAALLASPEPIPFTWTNPKGEVIELLLMPPDLDAAARGARAQAQYEARSHAWTAASIEAQRTKTAFHVPQPAPPDANAIMLDVIIEHTLWAGDRKPAFDAADKAALAAGASCSKSLFRALCEQFKRLAMGTDPEAAKDF